MCFAIGNEGDKNLERLAKETNGNVYIASDTNREMAARVIENAIEEVKSSKEINEVYSVIVYNEIVVLNEISITKNILIDSCIGLNTVFTISSENIDKFSVSIKSPSGKMFNVSSDGLVRDETLKLLKLKLRNSESGIWKIYFLKHSNQILQAGLSVTSQAINPNFARMRVWFKDENIATKMPPLIFTELRKGNTAVIGADVMAIIDKPDGTQASLKLDNYHDIYCNYFTDYCGPGRYNFSVSALSPPEILENISSMYFI